MKDELEALAALKRYGVFVLTPQRRLLLGQTLVELEKRKIKLPAAKSRLQGSILFTKKIVDALEKASSKKEAI